MKNKIQKILFASLCLNAAFIALFGALAYRKRGAIKEAVAKVCGAGGQTVGAGGQTTERLALAMNREVFEPVFGKCGDGERKIKLAFVGNSLTFHRRSSDLGWENDSGMAASSLENDYVHKTVNKIAQEKKLSVEYALLNIADFERHYERFDFSRLKKIADFSADCVVFQLGENLPADFDFDLFVEKYSSLVNGFGARKKIICLPFWHDANKNRAITQVALRTKSYLIDLSHLDGAFDKRNYAMSEAAYKHKGVGIHPGDYGMESISRAIYSFFNAELE